MSFDDKLKTMPLVGHKPRKPEEKVFVIRDILNIEKELEATGGWYQSKEEEFFNRKWSIVLESVQDPLTGEKHIKSYLKCSKPSNSPIQFIKVSFSIKLKSYNFARCQRILKGAFKGDEPVEQYGTVLCHWDSLRLTPKEKATIVKFNVIGDDELRRRKIWSQIGKPQGEVRFPHVITVWVKVKATGLMIRRGILSPNPEDVEIDVGGYIFYVNRKQISNISNWLKSAFIEGSVNQYHLKNDVDPLDFDNLLRVMNIYQPPSPLTDFNVEGVVLLAKMFKIEALFAKCENYIKNDSNLTLEKKFQLALQYGWETLVHSCVLSFKTQPEMYNSIPSYLQSIDASKIQEFWDKGLVLYLRGEEASEDQLEASQMIPDDGDEENAQKKLEK